MKEVKIATAALLTAVRKNREAHAEEVKLAREGYRIAVLKALAKRITDIEAGAEPSVYFHTRGAYGYEEDLQAPHDHTKDYDRVISMLEMSQDTETVLDAAEFNQYVMDEWAWAAHTKILNASYTRLVQR
jgi:hypothetical protein